MKGLSVSVEEKAAHYDAALEYAHRLIEQCKEGTEGSFHCADLQKMFPELQESEDERIRKELLSVVNDLVLPDEQRSRFVAWLEKQGEQKHTEEYNITGIKSKYAQGKLGEMIKRKLEMEKQGEQKPAWSEEDERFLNVATNILNASKVYTKSPNKYEDTINWLNSLKGRVSCEVKCTTAKEWGEKDERVRIALFLFVEAYGAYANYDVTQEEMLSWIESLKDRVQPQPHQEWSEEDESRIDNLCHFLEEYGNQYYGHLTLQGTISWLKSLRPQSHWKPSDEQMEALEKECIAHSNYELCRLLEQLKKLREE